MRTVVLVLVAALLCGCGVPYRECTDPPHKWTEWTAYIGPMARVSRTLFVRECEKCGLPQTKFVPEGGDRK